MGYRSLIGLLNNNDTSSQIISEFLLGPMMLSSILMFRVQIYNEFMNISS